jgi:hypothetical protein
VATIGGNLAQSYRNTSARCLFRDWEPFVLEATAGGFKRRSDSPSGRCAQFRTFVLGFQYQYVFFK